MVHSSFNLDDLTHIISSSLPKKFTSRDILRSSAFEQIFPLLVVFVIPFVLFRVTRWTMAFFSWIFSPSTFITKGREAMFMEREQVEVDDNEDLDEETVVSQHTNGYYPGIVNISGTYCFMNSVLQAMASLTYLWPYLQLVQSRAEQLDVPSPLLDTLKSFLRKLNIPSTFPSRPLHPHAIIEGISQSPGTQKRSQALLRTREHQDAQELFQLLSEGIKGEFISVLGEERDRAGFRFNDATVETGVGSGKEKLPLTSPFEGLTATRRSCMVCGYADAVVHYPFDNWNLSLPTMMTHTSLNTILGEYMKLEVLRDCICRKCSLLASKTHLETWMAELEREIAGADSEKSFVDTSTKHATLDTSNMFDALPSSSKPTKKRKKKPHRTPERDLLAAKSSYTLLNSALSQNRIEDPLPPTVPIDKVQSRLSTRQTVLARPPPILSLHLNRSVYTAYGATRNPIRVYFPEVLDMTPYAVSLTEGNPLEMRGDRGMCIGGDKPPGLTGSFSTSASTSATTPTLDVPWEERTLYRLASVICHYGAHSYGHYVCYRRKPNGLGRAPRIVGLSGVDGDEPVWEDQSQTEGEEGKGWLRTSDSSVREIGLKDVLVEASASCFLVFYERVVWDVKETKEEQEQEKEAVEKDKTGEPTKTASVSGLSMSSSTSTLTQARIVRSVGIVRSTPKVEGTPNGSPPHASTSSPTSSFTLKNEDLTPAPSQSIEDELTSSSIVIVPSPSSPTPTSDQDADMDDLLSSPGSHTSDAGAGKKKKSKKKKKKKV